MTSRHRNSTLSLAARALIIGASASAILNLIVLFVPMPDMVTETIVALQVVGLWIEIRRATPSHMSVWNPFLINAAVYAAIALALMAVRRSRATRLSVRAV